MFSARPRLGSAALLLGLLAVVCSAAEWDARNFPNPTGSGFRQCKLQSRGQVCDPDGVLTAAERDRLNYELRQLESRTYQEYGREFCQKKGFTAALAVARHVRGGSEAHVKAMANELKDSWQLDKQCQKSLVIVLALDDRRYWVARDDRIPISAAEFADLFNQQKSHLQQQRPHDALVNVLKGTAELTKQKQGQLPAGGGGGRPRPVDDGSGGFGRGGGGGGPGAADLLKKIPIKAVLLILLIVVPILLCCCLCYCCCCRGKGGQEAQSAEDGGQPGQRPGGAGGCLRQFMQGAAGSMAIQALMNCLRNQGGRGGGGGGPGGPRGGYVPPANRGDYQPGVPAQEGQGLYPSKPVKDEGAGGSW